ncbi:MAG: hypothetical protein D4R65_11910 [Verrucomicrobiaceae bacterium]|nr:MAG: hypothetical protein D4R65_11910 [Verrucomicrobiaceae bacterium]
MQVVRDVRENAEDARLLSYPVDFRSLQASSKNGRMMQMMQIGFFPQSGTRGNFIGTLWGKNPVSLISIIAAPIKLRRFKSEWEGGARVGRGRGSL